MSPHPGVPNIILANLVQLFSHEQEKYSRNLKSLLTWQVYYNFQEKYTQTQCFKLCLYMPPRNRRKQLEIGLPGVSSLTLMIILNHGN